MKKLISIIITLCMVVSLFAMTAFAAPEGGESAGGESAQEQGGGESAGGESGSGDNASGGSGGADSAGGGQGGGTAAAAETEIIDLVQEDLDELIIGPEGYEFTTDLHVGKLEIDPEAQITSEYPIVVFFDESESVENGTIINNVQFVSDYDEVVAIVHTNDVHGHINVEPYVKGLADELKASGDYSLVLTISAGDVYGAGEAVAGSYNGEFIPAIMDGVYDILAPGNNDYVSAGVARQNLLLTALFEHTQTLCANTVTLEDGLAMQEYVDSYEPKIGNELFDQLYEKVTLNEDGSLNLSALGLEDIPGNTDVYPDYTTFTTDNGTVIGVFGITTNGGALSTELDATGTIAGSQASADALREEGANVVVGVIHTGWMGEGVNDASSNDTNSWQVADQVNGVEVLIDGHTHSIIGAGQGILVGEDPTFINQAQSFGYCIGVMYLYIKDGEVLAIDGDVINDVESITPDAEVQEVVDLALARVKEDYGKPIAHTDVFLNGERLSAGNEGGTVRGNETNLGDLMTDVIKAAASEKMGVEYDFVCYPGYWLRSSIEAGDITLENMQSVFANPTVLYYDTCTAEDILAMVQKGLKAVYPQTEENTFNHYSGIKVTYTNDGSGSGTPVTIMVGDTLVYDAANGGLQVDESWTCEGVLTMTGGEIDSYTGDKANWICADKEAVQTLVGDWFQNHTADEYTIFDNTVAPDGRIVEVEG